MVLDRVIPLAYRPGGMASFPILTLEGLKHAAARFARLLSETPIPELYGVTDGKAVGTHVEAAFHSYLTNEFDHTPGSAAKGIDLPALDVDLKVTSIRQPQSSSPYRDAAQKVYGLGYHLLVFVYDKSDDAALEAARLDFRYVMFIDRELTSDFQTTSGSSASWRMTAMSMISTGFLRSGSSLSMRLAGERSLKGSWKIRPASAVSQSPMHSNGGSNTAAPSS